MTVAQLLSALRGYDRTAPVYIDRDGFLWVGPPNKPGGVPTKVRHKNVIDNIPYDDDRNAVKFTIR